MRRLLYSLCWFCFAFTVVEVDAQMFQEVSVKRGLDYQYPGITNYQIGGGVTVVDVNNDGWDDIFQAGGLFKSKLWINHHGKFKDETQTYQLGFLDSLIIQSAVSGDFNNDGWDDLFICNFGTGIGAGDHHVPVLLENKNGTCFRYRAMDNLPVGNYTTSSVADYNQDGWLDIYVTNYVENMQLLEDSMHQQIGYIPTCLPNLFLVNQGDFNFVNKAVELGLDDDGCGLACTFSDYDLDNDPDLFLMNDFGHWNGKSNKLFQNNFPLNTFTDVSVQSHFDTLIYGMGVTGGDYDRDGDFDYFVTNIGGNLFYINQGNGTFNERGKEMGLDNKLVRKGLPGTGWTGLFFDMDNDADLDLYVAQGNVETFTPLTAIKDPNKLYQNESENTFKDVSVFSGLDDSLSHRGAAVFDYDHDGDLDIVSSPVKLYFGDFSGLDQKIKLYENQLSHKGKWVKFKLVGVGPNNRNAYGAKIVVEVAGLTQVQEVNGGNGHGSQSSKTQHFGLPDNKAPLQVKVFWPGGNESVFTLKKKNVTYLIIENGPIQCVK
jgi:ASPIC and UnbV/FG-GAP-like repeat